MNRVMGGNSSQLRCANSSFPVTLTESSKVLGREVVVSAQVDDIFVSIKEAEASGRSGAIIAEPYQRRIETLKEGEAVTLEFETHQRRCAQRHR